VISLYEHARGDEALHRLEEIFFLTCAPATPLPESTAAGFQPHISRSDSDVSRPDIVPLIGNLFDSTSGAWE